ncbi:MAG: FecR domain-containing protein [Bacteriovoracaceae bacterium]
MKHFLFVLLFTFSLAHAQDGEVRTVKNATDGWIMRSGAKIKLAEGMGLKIGDSIHTENAQVGILLYPKIQMSLVKGTEITLTQHLIDDNNEQTTSLIDLVKGLVRIQVTRDGSEKIDQKVNTKEVTFAVRGTEYEVLATEADAELSVMEGEVEVTSPYVKSLVRELVKPGQGLRFDYKDRKFVHGAGKERVHDTLFLGRDEIRDRWEKKKAERLVKKMEHENKNGLKDKKMENVKDRVEDMLNRRGEPDDD